MFAADATFEVWPLFASALDSEFYQLSYALRVYGLEWVGIENLVAKIITHECANVIAREAEGHLRQVIRAE